MKIITVNSNGLGRYDDVSPFIITDRILKLKFNLPKLNGQFFFCAENNETKIKKFIPENGEVIVDNLKAGELIAEIKHYIRGELIECYKVEPLLLRSVDCNIMGAPEISRLEEENAKLKQLLAETNGLVKKIDSRLISLIRFAYADFKYNVYLSGGTLDDFLNEYKIELSEEERKKIYSKE